MFIWSGCLPLEKRSSTEGSIEDASYHSDIVIVSAHANDPSLVLLSTEGNVLPLEWSSSQQRFVVSLDEQVILFDSQGIITRFIQHGGVTSV